MKKYFPPPIFPIRNINRNVGGNVDGNIYISGGGGDTLFIKKSFSETHEIYSLSLWKRKKKKKKKKKKREREKERKEEEEEEEEEKKRSRSSVTAAPNRNSIANDK